MHPAPSLSDPRVHANVPRAGSSHGCGGGIPCRSGTYGDGALLCAFLLVAGVLGADASVGGAQGMMVGVAALD